MGIWIRNVSALAASALIMACATLPDRVDTLEEARERVEALESDPLARDVAEQRYENARRALERADAAYDDNDDLEVIEHEAYLALRNAQIAEQQIAQHRARQELEDGESERNRLLLEAREREAERAQALAEQRRGQLEERSEELETRADELARQQERVAELEASTEELETELAALEAQQTERGLVMTLGDVLFDVGGSQLQPGAESTLQRLAEFLREYPEREVVIEGHTDSTGPASLNQALSERRAESVQAALAGRGIERDRIHTRGLGESFPVASNDTAATRQRNRRVEIILSDEEGRFPDGAMRSASAGEAD
jgi:outer membrane protein OmpA-like peptidoglycan-associated protein